MEKEFKPILGKGENYISAAQPRKRGGGSDNKPTFKEVSSKLITQLNLLKKDIDKVDSQNRVEEIVVNLKTGLGYSAKSYHPHSLIKEVGAVEVGTKKWEGNVKGSKGETIKAGKNIFLRVNEEVLDKMQALLEKDESQLTKSVVDEVRVLDSIFFESNSRLLNIFSADWTEGRVEFVLHPFGINEQKVLEKFKDNFVAQGGDLKRLSIRSYENGPVFISAFLTKENLRNLILFNPIRTCHPLEIRHLPSIKVERNGTFPLPRVPLNLFPSKIKVGVFDGGVPEHAPLIDAFVKKHNPIPTNSNDSCVQHGLGVVGAILYGDLKNYQAGTNLPTPTVNVESYRVLPLSDNLDYDLYEIIDIIEQEVPKRNDIKVFNLSLGPAGPIEDDSISRFTYVIDKLSSDGERLFVVAVGNDGDLNEGSNRIQAPSDTVNGLGVGAYVLNSKQEKIRASYSCIGSGREGSKVKPDILDFGGDSSMPFQLIGLDGTNKYYACGTSFSAPLITRKAAELMGRCNMIDALTSKALLINSAQHPTSTPDKQIGYGFVPETIEELLGCTENKVTVLYRKKILPKSYAKLEIPVVKNLNYKGKVKVTWTIAIAAKPNILNTEDYTSVCLEDVFYPHSEKYKLTKEENGRTLTKTIDKAANAEEWNQLINDNWKVSNYPKSVSPEKPKTEENRKKDFKWDTILRKEQILKYNSLNDPYLVLHAMDRYISPEESDFIEYAVVVSVEYLNYKGDAYHETVKQFNLLEQAHIRNENELIIKV